MRDLTEAQETAETLARRAVALDTVGDLGVRTRAASLGCIRRVAGEEDGHCLDELVATVCGGVGPALGLVAVEEAVAAVVAGGG